MISTLLMGTRGSPLALAQARQIARQIEKANSGLEIVEKIIRTTGDRQQSAPLPSIGGKGVFTLEIEAALLDGSIDFAVHSLKDLPPLFPNGLSLGAVPRRESSADACLLSQALSDLNIADAVEIWPQLPLKAHVGTSSLRRAAQLKYARPDLQIESVRGNIDTRLRKLDEHFDAIILARAGLNRLNVDLSTRRHFDLPADDFLAAPGQGALALEARTDDERVLKVLWGVEDAATRGEIEAERACMEALGAGCSTPLGARAVAAQSTLNLRAVVLSPYGTQRIFAQAQSTLDEAKSLGALVAQQLLEQGAAQLMDK